MIKIPATKAGLPAIISSIAVGINVNVTLIFSVQRYEAVMDAYLTGLEQRVEAGDPIDHVASVASFFVSRIDSKIDARLGDSSELKGKVAIANAKVAYAVHKEIFSGARWDALEAKGAQIQRALWASTSTKNPDYPDTMYVDQLIGPKTVNTVPPKTLMAFAEHGAAELNLEKDLESARAAFDELDALGISMDEVTQELEDEGVKSFADAFTSLLDTIENRRLVTD